MLKLAVKPGETITIGNNIRIQLADEASGNARLLIDAPRDYDIKREKKEITEKRVERIEVKKNNVFIVKNK